MIVVREADPGDADALVALLRDLLAEPGMNIPLQPDEMTHTVDSVRAALAEPRAIRLVATHDGVVVGELGLKPISARRALLHVATLGLSVARAWRRRGVGRALMAEGIARAPARGFSRLELNVYARNAAAIALYEELGFELEGRRRRFIRDGDDYLDDLLMARLL